MFLKTEDMQKTNHENVVWFNNPSPKRNWQASGAGKSTILKLCARLADPQDPAEGWNMLKPPTGKKEEVQIC